MNSRLALCLILLSVTPVALRGAQTPGGPVAPVASSQLSDSQQLRVTPIVQLVQEVGPAVVNIYQEVVQEVELQWPYNRIYGPQRTRRSTLGSGVLIDPEGYILTNAHVIFSMTPENIQVRLADGSTHQAQLINTDPSNDVALLKIYPDRELVTARLGTSADAMVGETVVAIGNPLGNENTVTTGIISSVFREVRGPGPARTARFKDFIQLDAAINPGNSGGPLLNVLGEVIGINWAIATGAEGIGFAIPIDRVRESLTDTLLNSGVGGGADTGAKVAAGDGGRDVRFASIRAGGPAARAGLRPGDRLVSMEGTPVTWEFDYNKILYLKQPGERLPLVVQRDGELIPVELQLEGGEAPMQYILRTLGLRVVDHPKFFGVAVESVDPGGVAAQLPMLRNDLIDGVDGVDVNDVQQLYEALRRVPSGSAVKLHLFRDGQALSGRLRL